MGLGKNIKKFRIESGLTQKDLAEKLFVTAQAVSRWEKDIVEPNIQTLKQMSVVFGISIDDIISEVPAEEEIKEIETTEIKQVLCMCDTCHKPIYIGDKVLDTKEANGSIIHECQDCNTRRKNRIIAIKKAEENQKIERGIKKRTTAIVISSIVLTLGILISLLLINKTPNNGLVVSLGCVGTVLFSMFLFVMIVNNTFIPDMWETVASWGFVKFPGLIFTLNLDGIIWLLTVKLLFWIIGFSIASIAFLGATALGMLLSIFVFPFALTKSIKNPELSNQY